MTTDAEGKWVWPNDAANHPDGPHPNGIENQKEQEDSGSVKLLRVPKPGETPLLYERLIREDGILSNSPPHIHLVGKHFSRRPNPAFTVRLVPTLPAGDTRRHISPVTKPQGGFSRHSGSHGMTPSRALQES